MYLLFWIWPSLGPLINSCQKFLCIWKKTNLWLNSDLKSLQKSQKNKSDALFICTWFLEIKFDKLDFWSILNLIFTTSVACKIQVWKRPKIKFVQFNFSKIKCRSIGGKANILDVFLIDLKTPKKFLSKLTDL